MRDATALQPLPSTGPFEESAHSGTEARLAALVGGAALITLAARDRSWRGIGLALVGAPLVWRGTTGNWPVQRTATEATAETAQNGEIDPSRLITHRLNLEEAPEAYQTFRDKEDSCIKVVMKPQWDRAHGNGNGHAHLHHHGNGGFGES